eukprot:4221371-Pleurochrysis_carterae.AAC.1
MASSGGPISGIGYSKGGAHILIKFQLCQPEPLCHICRIVVEHKFCPTGRVSVAPGWYSR